VAQKYIDTLMEIPWTQYTLDAKDMVLSERILEQEHTGMKAVK
jgi:ATP-dependent Lon protease